MVKHNTKYTKEILQKAVIGSRSLAETMRKLGVTYISGGLHSHLKRCIVKFDIDINHFLGQASNCGTNHVGGPDKLTAKDIFVYNRRNGYREYAQYLRRALDEIGRKRVCVKCNCGEVWQGDPIMLEVDHKNRDPLDNRADNLEYRCPNCHSQIPNHAKRRSSAGVV